MPLPGGVSMTPWCPATSSSRQPRVQHSSWDFGLGPLFMPVGSPAYSTDKDLTGIAAFARLRTQRAQETANPRQL